MKQKINPQDAPKIAIALALLMAVSGVGWMSLQKSTVRNEEARAQLQLKRETGAYIKAGDESLTAVELDDAENKRAEADPNFQS